MCVDGLDLPGCQLCSVYRCREDVPKQEGFVDNLVQYTSSQWREFFRMTPTTAQRLVETIGPFFAERSGWLNYQFIQFVTA